MTEVRAWMTRTAKGQSTVRSGEPVAQQRRGLGRGLGALIPDSPLLADRDAARDTTAASAAGQPPVREQHVPGSLAEVAGARYEEIAITAITPNPRQPRRSFDEETVDELAESIRQVGLLQPVVVRAAGPGRPVRWRS